MVSNHPLKRTLASKRPDTTPQNARWYNPGVGTHSTLPTDQNANITENSRRINTNQPSEGPLTICHRRLQRCFITHDAPLLSCLIAQYTPLPAILISGSIFPSHYISEAVISSGLVDCSTIGRSYRVIG